MVNTGGLLGVVTGPCRRGLDDDDERVTIDLDSEEGCESNGRNKTITCHANHVEFVSLAGNHQAQDRVRLLINLPDFSLKAGDIGTVIGPCRHYLLEETDGRLLVHFDAGIQLNVHIDSVRALNERKEHEPPPPPPVASVPAAAELDDDLDDDHAVEGRPARRARAKKGVDPSKSDAGGSSDSEGEKEASEDDPPDDDDGSDYSMAASSDAESDDSDLSDVSGTCNPLPRAWKEQNLAHEDYQQFIFDFFTGKVVSGKDWSTELKRMQDRCQARDSAAALTVWQEVGYRHAQSVLSSRDVKGCIYWWTPGSGKSIMVALLMELAMAKGLEILVVSTPQNIRENHLEQCIKSLLKFSPVYSKRGRARGANAGGEGVTDEAVQKLQAEFRRKKPGVLKKNFMSLRTFQNQCQKGMWDMGNVCVIVDECHEVFNERACDARVVLSHLAKARKVFTLSGTPWRTGHELQAQLALLHYDQAHVRSSLAPLMGGVEEGRDSTADMTQDEKLQLLKECCRGRVSYVDGTRDRSNFPLKAPIQVAECPMSPAQLHNHNLRCQPQLNRLKRVFSDKYGLDEPDNFAELALGLVSKQRLVHKECVTTCRLAQVAGGVSWAGLREVVQSARRMREDAEVPSTDAFLGDVARFAPKFRVLIEAMLGPGRLEEAGEDGRVDGSDTMDNSVDIELRDSMLQTKHFVYSTSQSSVTHLRKTLLAPALHACFGEVTAQDLEWIDVHDKKKGVRVKESVQTEGHALLFVCLKGSASDQFKLKAAFGFMTSDSTRYDGLQRAPGVPLIQILIGSHECNQGLTFLRLQHIHILEPNPKGWGKVIQTIGRGVRRGTHTGLDSRFCTVHTTIYLTTLELGSGSSLQKYADERQQTLEAELRELEAERDLVTGALTERAFEHEELEEADDEEIDERYRKKELKRLTREMAQLEKNLENLEKCEGALADKLAQMRDDGLVEVPTGKFKKRRRPRRRKKGDTAEHEEAQSNEDQQMVEKLALTKTWQMLADEAVLHVISGEEDTRDQCDETIKRAAVDFILLQDFHGWEDGGGVGCLQDLHAMMARSRVRFESARRQHKASWAGEFTGADVSMLEEEDFHRNAAGRLAQEEEAAAVAEVEEEEEEEEEKEEEEEEERRRKGGG